MTANDKWRVAERLAARILQKAAGKVRDPALAQLVTSTGRVGHLTTLGVDILAGNKEDGTALIGEVKRRNLPAWFHQALTQIVARGYEYDRTPVMVFQLADDAETWIETKVGKRRNIRTWAMFPIDYAAELLEERRKHNGVE